MAWYGWFAKVYDQSLERLYAPHRETLFACAQGQPASVLDVACGTGQNFPLVQARLAKGGRLVGVDLSEGMLARAQARIREGGWANVALHQADVRTLAPDARTEALSDLPTRFDWVVCTLGLTVVPDWQSVFGAAWALLQDGGQFLILDVWAEQRGFQTWMVEKMAQADLSRRVFEPLQAVSEDFELHWLDAKPATFGGKLFAAAGRKPFA